MDFEAQVLPAQIKILRRAELIAHPGKLSNFCSVDLLVSSSIF